MHLFLSNAVIYRRDTIECQSHRDIAHNEMLPSKRKQTLSEAWQAHVANATNVQLSSPESCRAFLRAFTSDAVQSGLVGTALEGQDDLQQVIVSLLAGQPNLPSAAALKVVAEETRKLETLKLAEEIANHAKDAAATGLFSATVSMSCCPSFKDFMDDDDCGELLSVALTAAGFKDGFNARSEKIELQGYSGAHYVRIRWG